MILAIKNYSNRDRQNPDQDKRATIEKATTAPRGWELCLTLIAMKLKFVKLHRIARPIEREFSEATLSSLSTAVALKASSEVDPNYWTTGERFLDRGDCSL